MHAHNEVPNETGTFSSGAPQNFMSPDWDDVILWSVVFVVQCLSGHCTWMSVNIRLARAFKCHPDLATRSAKALWNGECRSQEGRVWPNTGSDPWAMVSAALP